MPTTFPNGLVVYNATLHDLNFWFEGGVVVAPPDQLINAHMMSRTVEHTPEYNLVEVTYTQTEEGRETIRSIRERDPKALIVGSVIAANAYPGEIVSPIPVNASRKHPARTLQDKYNRLVYSNKFMTSKVEERQNHYGD